MWSVYCHENKINGKRYIGITSQDVIRRWRNGKGYNSVFGRAIQKYGWDNFEHIILVEDMSEEFAKSKEQELIKLFNCGVPNGYNVTDGGDGTVGYKRDLSGNHNPFYGKHCSDEHKNKIIKATSKRVVQYTKDNEFVRVYAGIREASRELNVNHCNINLCCQGKKKSAYGYLWRYE